MSLRLAEPQDYPIVKEMLLKFIESTPYSHYDVDPTKLDELILGLVALGKEEAIILCATEDDQVVGMLAARATEFLFNRNKIASEMAWWVEPGYRRHGIELKKAFEYWAEKIGAKYNSMSSLNTEKVNRYLVRDGYRMTECTFVKEI